MNEKTKVKYELAKMYEYVNEILDICKRYDNDYDEIADDMLSYNAILMLIIQLGERSVHIRDTNFDFYESCPMKLKDVINMRNRITHGYTNINRKLFISAIKEDIPFFREYIEDEVHEEILDDPYVLYDIEYDDFIENRENQLEL